VDERPFNLVRQFIREMPIKKRPTLAQLKKRSSARASSCSSTEDERSRRSPKLLTDVEERQRALERARQIAAAKAGKLSDAQEARFGASRRSSASPRPTNSATYHPHPYPPRRGGEDSGKRDYHPRPRRRSRASGGGRGRGGEGSRIPR